MSSDQVSNTKKKSGVATSKPSPKRARKLRSDDGANILPNAENFVSLVRKVTHPGLLVDLIERTSATALPELKRMVEVANGGKLPIESRKAFFHAVGELEETTLNRIECAAEVPRKHLPRNGRVDRCRTPARRRPSPPPAGIRSV